jgi:hypothetical protein
MTIRSALGSMALLFGLLGGALLACADEDLNAAPRRQDAGPPSTTCDPEGSFGALIEERCLGCHTRPVGTQGSYTAEERAKWRPGVEWRAVFAAIEAKRMPPPGNAPLADDAIRTAGVCLAEIGSECSPGLPKRAAMISRNYFLHALEEIFPPAVAIASKPLLDGLAHSDPKETFRSITIGGERSSVSVAFQVGWKIAFQVLGTAAAIDGLDKCLPAYASSNAAQREGCIDGVLDRYSQSILRQPPGPDDRTKIKAVFAEGAANADHREGLRFAIAYLLQRPEFLYHVETGLAAAGRLTHEQILAKLSRYLWDGPPDATLVGWAVGKDLSAPEPREQIARQMLADPRARRQLVSFYGELLKLDDEGGALTTNPKILEGVSTSTLRAEARTEIDSFVEHVAFTRAAKLADLFTSNESTVPSANLAMIYGVPAGAVGTLTQLPNRRGILTRVAMLTAPGETPNIFHFGALVAKNLLCNAIPPPDPAALLEAAKIQIPTNATARERAELQTGDGVCVGCHGQFNAYGYARAGYSTIGRELTVEKVFDATGAVVREAPVSTAGTVVVDGKSVPVNDLNDVSEVLATSQAATRCFVAKYVSYSEGRAVGNGDTCFVERLTAEVTKGGLSLQDALAKVVASSEFVTRGEER